MVKSKLALSPKQLRTLTSPVRAEIVRALSAEGQKSIKELAAALGRSTTRLYHHMQVLRDAGLVRAAETRRVGAREEALFELVAPHLSSAEAVRTNEGRDALGAVARRFIATAARRFAQAIASPGVGVEGPARALSIRQIQIRADAARLAGLNDDLDALIDRHSSRSDDGQPVTLTIIVTPGA